MPPQPDGLLHGVARRARNVGDDHAVEAREAVQQARLARVRAAEDDGGQAVLHDASPVAGGEQAVERLCVAVQLSRKLRQLKRVDVLVRIVQNGVEMRQNIH